MRIFKKGQVVIWEYSLRSSGLGISIGIIQCFRDEHLPRILAWAQEELKIPRIEPLYVYTILFNVLLGLRYAELANLLRENNNWQDHIILVYKQSTSSGTPI